MRECPYRSIAHISDQLLVSSHSILRSFVSSHKSDVYRCYSTFESTDTTLPYACSYSHGAKNGGRPLIAVATEQGSLIVVNTLKRRDWDYEPQRTTYQPHNNGVFDVQWSNDDSLLTTASGDKSIRVSSVETQKSLYVLRGHSGTAKCVVWDPTHDDLLSSGGRDGSICVWDLRLNSSQNAENKTSVLSPVLVIPAAHGQDTSKGRKKKVLPLPKSVTGLIYPNSQPHGLISSGSSDGILRFWDLRLPTAIPNGKGSNKTAKSAVAPVSLSMLDPTIMNGTRRPRGITSLAMGAGPTAGLIFASGADSHLHTYSLPFLMPLGSYGHPNMRISSFYVQVAVSPCGRWLASGSSDKDGSMFLFDVSNASRTFVSPSTRSAPAWLPNGVQLQGQKGEISAVDWAEDMIASCADDHTVRIWRPDVEVYKKCIAEPEEQRWNWSWSTQGHA
ncbi:hypothetical protein SERLA73DRAFT_49690 [Serpula lacrymans var. lacrymans S7.3]|uniref:Anaphase-promoting complex subunit 4 WD40 domain-containing protein n=1 Tax=Serpula lacrymans var. lacrymans (strain S7.3) TaxID=936435 RepID=F8PR16_SERL3|nr:hypothetical protein SERLA73DRAFT_49690 [Serpula lacrymans var. lacrymans S7.3]